MRKKLIFGIMLILTLLLLMPSIPAINRNVVKDELLNDITQELNLEIFREDIINAISEYNWKDIINVIIIIILSLCLGFVETYTSTIMYNEDNDLYPILTKLFEKIFFIPAMIFSVIAVLILIIFDPIPPP